MDKNMKTNKPIISVIMPVYNGELYLKEAIESILNQTISDFEFIIINDGSTDNTEEIIMSYDDKRIIYRKQNNKGIGAALRYGCSLAEGIYIARMDADDISELNRFQIQYDYLKKHPKTIVISSAVRYIDEKGKVLGRSYPLTCNQAIRKNLQKGNPICHPGAMLVNAAYKKINGYQDLQPLEDYFLWLKLSKLGKVTNTSKPYLKYRIHDNNSSSSISDEHYEYLKALLILNVNNETNNESYIEDFKLYLIKAKTEFKWMKKQRDAVKSNNGIRLNKKHEVFIWKIMRKFKFSENNTGYIICNLKNLFSVISS
jgi:glycosyltransferase involved in cell wall biosynthesis